MSSVSSTSSAPLFTIKNPNQLLFDPADRSESILKMSVYSSHKVTLKTAKGRELEIKPKGFKNVYCENKDFLKKNHAWQIKQSSDKTFAVYATFRVLGGGNDSSTLKVTSLSNTPKKMVTTSKVGTTTNDGPVKLTKEEEKLLTRHIKFPPEKHKDEKARKYALEKACDLSLSNGEIQTQIIEILLLKLKIQVSEYAAHRLLSPDGSKIINKEAVKVFIQAGLKYNQLDLQTLVSHKNFDLYQKVLDNQPDLNQQSFTYLPKSPFFYEVDKEERYECRPFPFSHWIILEDIDPQFFNYFKKTQTLNKEMIDQKVPLGRTLLMCMLNQPETYADRLEWVLQFNPNMNALDSKGRTALFYLLMSVDPSTFEKYLDLLFQHGLNLNQAISEKDTQFSQCLNLLVDLDVKNKDMQILNFEQKSDLLQKLAYLLYRGADCSRVSLETFLSLLPSLQAMIEESVAARPASLDTSESADTSSSTPPKTNILSPLGTKLNSFWDQFPLLEIASEVKSMLERAFRASKLSLVFSDINAAWQKSIFAYLNEKLGNAIRNGAHASPTFEAGIINILNQWKGAQQKDISEKHAGVQQSQALEQEKDELKKLAEEANRKKEEAKEAEKKAIAAQRAADQKKEQSIYYDNFRDRMGWTGSSKY